MCKIGAVILAAGKSVRMGKPKLLLPYKGNPLFTYPLKLALHQQLQPIVCVTGRYHVQMKEIIEFEKMNITLTYNPFFESGLSSSLKAGIHTMKDQVDGAMIFLGDQPLIPNEVVQKIHEEFKKEKKKGIKIIRPLFGNRFGHPILFDRSLFPEFNKLQGDEGGKSILKHHQASLKLLQFANEDWGIDIDTQEEYETLLKRTEVNDFT